MSGDYRPSWLFRFGRMNFQKCSLTRFFEKWGNFWGVQHSPSIWKMELRSLLLHPCAYSFAYSVKIFVIYHKGAPDNVPPFTPRRLFWKFEALAFQNFLSKKSEKNSQRGDLRWARAHQVSLPHMDPFPFPETFDKFFQKILGVTAFPSPRSEKSLKHTGCGYQ